jgi:hypothetical protein
VLSVEASAPAGTGIFEVHRGSGTGWVPAETQVTPVKETQQILVVADSSGSSPLLGGVTGALVRDGAPSSQDEAVV